MINYLILHLLFIVYALNTVLGRMGPCRFPAPAYSYAIVHFLPSRYPSVHHAYR